MMFVFGLGQAFEFFQGFCKFLHRRFEGCFRRQIDARTLQNRNGIGAAAALQEGEIDAMLATENLKLTGDVALDLEKIYLQQLMHFTMMPDDQFVTARRSGCPKNGSSLLNYEYFDGIAINAIPRRFPVSAPSPTDKMKENLEEAYQAQGFTTGSNQSGGAFNTTGSVLNTERIWFDKTSPNWGQGPKM